MSLKERLLKTSKLANTAPLDESKIFNDVDFCPTKIPILNLVLSGQFDGGITSGLTVLAGPSKHFKSNLGLVFVAAYMKKNPDAMCIFYDSEFGSRDTYFKSQGIDPSRVIHTPFINIEELTFDLIAQLDGIDRKDKVIIFVDSIGNSSSKKELTDVLKEDSKTDMTRAKSIKALFRMATPYLTLKDIPMVAINHTYQTQEMYSKTVMSGGTGIAYSANTTIFIGRQQEKDGTEVVGYNFILNVDKSRFVREKSKFPLSVTFNGGINTFTGLLEVAQDVGFVVKPKNGWYARAYLDEETGELVAEDKNWREKDTNTLEFWRPLFQHTAFKEACRERYQLKSIVSDESIDKEIQELL